MDTFDSFLTWNVSVESWEDRGRHLSPSHRPACDGEHPIGLNGEHRVTCLCSVLTNSDENTNELDVNETEEKYSTLNI